MEIHFILLESLNSHRIIIIDCWWIILYEKLISFVRFRIFGEFKSPFIIIFYFPCKLSVSRVSSRSLYANFCYYIGFKFTCFVLLVNFYCLIWFSGFWNLFLFFDWVISLKLDCFLFSWLFSKNFMNFFTRYFFNLFSLNFLSMFNLSILFLSF